MQLLYYGIVVPQQYDNDHWSHDFRNWLDGLSFEYDTGKEVLQNRMRSFRFIDQEFRNVSTSLRRHTKTYYKKDYMLLRSVLGIGPIVASGILSELGDLRGFDNIKHLTGYVGMCPGIYQSGNTQANRGEHACTPIDTKLFYRGLMAGHRYRPRNADLLPKAPG